MSILSKRKGTTAQRKGRSYSKSMVVIARNAFILLLAVALLYNIGTAPTTDKNKWIKSRRASTSPWDSSKSVVIGLASGYGLGTFKTFVGSLRYTGYSGNIILGIAENAPDDVLEYLAKHNVITKKLKVLPPEQCTFYNRTTVDGNALYNRNCFENYPHYKFSWARFPLAKDWLLQCKQCTDGVMLTDIRDAYFQADPFAAVTEPKGLMVFEEHEKITNENWLTDIPVKKCRDHTVGPTPMLCSGSTMGSREGILEYLDVMVSEMDYWNQHDNCRSNMAGDDQSIHNYLYYADRFSNIPNVAAFPHRTGPIHVVGYEADKIFRAAIKQHAATNHVSLQEAESYVNGHRYYGTDLDNENDPEQKWRNWLGPEHNLIDAATGFITNLDGKPSPQVHQFDRFGPAFSTPWVNRMTNEVWN